MKELRCQIFVCRWQEPFLQMAIDDYRETHSACLNFNDQDVIDLFICDLLDKELKEYANKG